MKAIILAAGLGTKLRPLSSTIPKVMLPIQNKPLLKHLITNLKDFGITEIGISLHYLPDVIIDYFGDGSKFGVDIVYSSESDIQGTAGSVNGFKKWIDNDDFLLIYGDNYFYMDYSKLIKFFGNNLDIIAGIGLQHSPIIKGKGLATIDDNNIILSFVEKPENPEKLKTDLVNTGIYFLRNQILEYIPEDRPSDFSCEIFPNLLKQNEKLLAYIIKEKLVDIGTPEIYNSLK